MPALKYAIENDGLKRLELSWHLAWNGLKVSLDGTNVGVLNDIEALRRGQELTLPDGSTLHVLIDEQSQYLLHRNGVPIPGAPNDPRTVLRTACRGIFLSSGLVAFLALACCKAENFHRGGLYFAMAVALFLLARKAKHANFLAFAGAAAVCCLHVVVLTASGFIAFMDNQPASDIAGAFYTLPMLYWIRHGFGAIREIESARS